MGTHAESKLMWKRRSRRELPSSLPPAIRPEGGPGKGAMMREQFDVVMASPLPGGLRIGLRFTEAGLSEAEWLPADAPLRQPHDARQKDAVEQLDAFLRDGKAKFDLPLDLHGTEHQLRVWRALLRIPAGEVKSYGEVARELHSSARAVGNACRSNPLPIIVPCHRVVAAQGLGGYMGAFSGDPLAIKQWLLRHEGALRE